MLVDKKKYDLGSRGSRERRGRRGVGGDNVLCTCPVDVPTARFKASRYLSAVIAGITLAS